MARSVFHFLSRRPETPDLGNATYRLRLPQMSDFDAWRRLRVESRDFLQPWEPSWRPDEFTSHSFRARVQRNEQEYQSGAAVPLFIFERSSGGLLGGLTIGLIRRGAAQACMIGYWMGAPHAGKGHMFAALAIAKPYIFGELQLHRIEAACIPDNVKSMRLLQRSGFKTEGLLRQYLKINGAWRDHQLFALLSTDVSLNGDTRCE
ncbi:GNAT family N-acetyltransferase [Rhizobium halophytocola]|uniref:Ribosomal-protein-alanine N-acetyltransferase n=1 Tax=Rhizobium halophytocola TaxID=735519 RepID=A0ABS4DX64_9HYPH|nr:GNAT family protein [Rhizobium halophytocola]MBP1850288.1 ribosomal-protein-alanine N-acetyltransferase [Rhizobium halophytocola]